MKDIAVHVNYNNIVELIESGINLFSDQSPPPITFPALALARPHFFLLKKLSW